MNPSNLARTLLWLAVVSCTAGPALAEIKFPGQAGAARGSDTQARAGGGASAGIDSGAEAALREGLEYHRNSGVPMAPALARQRLKQAATAGDARGMVAYGWLLANGIGGLRDVEQAREWINEARIAGLARATFVSSLIEGRISGAKKRVESLQLLEQAARDGDAMAANNLGVAMELEGNLTGARTLYETAALQGNAVARENLERMRRLTRGGDALNLSRLRLQADDGDTDAMLQLAQRYHRGEGVQQDFAQAIQHYRRAADGGSQRAREFLALNFSRPARDPAQICDVAWMRELAARVNIQSDRRAGGGALNSDRPRRNEDPLEGLAEQRASARSLALMGGAPTTALRRAPVEPAAEPAVEPAPMAEPAVAPAPSAAQAAVPAPVEPPPPQAAAPAAPEPAAEPVEAESTQE